MVVTPQRCCSARRLPLACRLLAPVACELVKTELAALGLRTTFVPLQIELSADEWSGVTRPYWQRDVYYLPISVYLP